MARQKTVASTRTQAPNATAIQLPQASVTPKGSRFTRRSNAQEDTQRRVQNQSLRRTRDEGTGDAAARLKDSDEKRNSPAAGGSWGRAGHGRQFTVGNIGNNGKIYLRPVVRPGNQRSIPQQTTQPISKPKTDEFPYGTDAHKTRRRPSSSVGHESFFSSTFTIPKARKDRPHQEVQQQSAVRSPPKASTHVRAHSFSTINDAAPRPVLEQPGTFRVVINRPEPAKVKHQRSSGDLPALPVIEVPIPDYKLGTPQFGTRGSAAIRGSTYATSSGKDKPESPKASLSGQGRLLRSPDALRSSSLFRRHSEAFPRPLFDRKSTSEMVGPRSSLPSQAVTRYSIMTSAGYVYDYLAQNPDDPSVVRYAPHTTEILAATPSRLIAHITSPSFLDYELLSDFFLTFRSFIQPDELVSFLISRLQWAVNRVDDFGRIVRVRTFVALRHWILNYFVDDFAMDEDLRKHFCKLVNHLYDFLHSRSDGGGGDIKIIGELKKCWRRTCALHWGTGDPYAQDSPEDPIVSSGPPPGPSSVETAIPTSPPAVHQPTRQTKEGPKIATHSAKPSTVKQPKAPSSTQHAPHPSVISAQHSYLYSARTGTMTEQGAPMSRSSKQSSLVLSCSIPMKPIYRSDRGAEIPLFPHPVPTGAPSLTITPSPTSPKPPHPLQSHVRAQSFYDPLKAARQSVVLAEGRGDEFEIPAIYVVPGSLVRGVLYQPDAPYFDFKSFGSLISNKGIVQIEMPDTLSSPGGNNQPQSNPGVKKLFGSVRRALSSKQGTLANGGHLDPTFPPAAGQLLSPPVQPSETLSVSQLPGKSSQRQRAQVRIDLLAARVAETFKEAVEAGMEEDRAIERDILAFTKGRGSSDDGTLPRTHDRRFERSVTIGSCSIVIMDDTNADVHMMSGALNPPSSLFNGDRGTMSMYEDYVASATRDFRSQRNQGNRQTGASIDGMLVGEKGASPGTETPAVYLPTGFKEAIRESVDARSVGAPRQWSRQRFSNSLRSSFSAGHSLRRYASYHSGVSTPMSKRVVHPQRSLVGASKSSDGEDFILGKPPVRQLRRKPGGDLKAATKVRGSQPPARPNSTGSIASQKPSVVDSISLATSAQASVTTATPKGTPKRRRAARDGEGDRRSISLIQTHSSQPNLRPSFEAEVAKLAALPDDDNDDGGIEAALLKLEGKFEKKSPVSTPVQPTFKALPVISPAKSEFSAHSDWLPGEDEHARKIRHHKEHVQTIQGDHPVSPVSPRFFDPVSPVSPRFLVNAQTASIHRISQSSDIPIPPYLYPSQNSVAGTEESYSSIPLLERSHSGPSNVNLRKLERLVIRDSIPGNSAKEQQEQESTNSSIEHVVKTDSLHRIPVGDSVPRSPTMHESFLLDDQEDMSVGSGGMYEPSDTESQGVRSFFDDEAVEDDGAFKPAFAHPLRHPDTPPVLSSPRKRTPPVVQPTTFNQGLPTPGLTPKANPNFQTTSPTTPKAHQRAKPSEVTNPTSHLPFILAFDAEILAQQFTIIEKDALDEIDWKELIELRWRQTSPSVKDWVDYLRTQDPHGVDLVIARFNLVVKWINSEIVLTENQDERVKCIIHYIHIASHCRRLRNYATMYQITIALLQVDCSRLKKTWEQVPAAEMQTFKDLEQCVQPIRNFHNLRVEMETCMSDDGCIPFIGIYTRDLVYNAQKPPFITSPPLNADEPLVNFERHHTAATIVKSLLRLLEASAKYQFTIEPTIIGKCLWLATLAEEEITARSKRLE